MELLDQQVTPEGPPLAPSGDAGADQLDAGQTDAQTPDTWRQAATDPSWRQMRRPSRQSRQRRRRWAAGLAGLVTVSALALGGSTALAAGPSSSPASGGATGPTTDPAAIEAALKDYAACMRSHGVDMADPTTTKGANGSFSVTTGALGVSVSGASKSTAGTVTAGADGMVAVGAGVPGVAADGNPGPVVASPDPKFAAADAACQPILQAAGLGAPAGASGIGTVSLGAGTASGRAGVSLGIVANGSSGDAAGLLDSMKAYAACMRGKGIDIPDPKVDSKTGAVELTANVGTSGADFAAADAACEANGVHLLGPAGAPALPALPEPSAPAGSN